MKQQIFHTILIASLLTVGCNKIDLPDPVDGDPVFTADLVLDGTETSLAAGVDGYYLSTSFEHGIDDVYTFSGELRLQDSCNANLCPPSLSIHIRDFQQVTNGLPNINEALALGEYAYRSDSVTTGGTWVYDTIIVDYRVKLYADSTFATPATTQFFWEMGTGAGAFGPSTVAVFDMLEPAPEVTLTYLEFSNFDSCVSTATQRIRPVGQAPCSVSIQPTFDSTGLTQLQAVTMGTGNFLYQWNTGAAGPVLVQGLAQWEEYVVTITDSNGCQASAGIRPPNFVNPDNPPNNCRASFSYEVEELLIIDSTFVPNTDPLQLSRVTLVYTSETGDVYRSDLGIQPVNASFQLSEVMDFDDNENGLPTKKFSLKFNCTLWNEAGETITVGPGSRAVWGVAYPR